MSPPNMKVIAFIIYGIQKQWNTMEYYGKLSKPPSKMRNGQITMPNKKGHYCCLVIISRSFSQGNLL